jgi:RNA polymerase sigma-70 factor (ECF subfamily)
LIAPDRRSLYAEFIELHREELRAHCMRILRSPHDAEDALQEALLRAWRSRDQFDGRGSARSWLYRIATNASLDQLRRRREPAVADELADRTQLEDHVERREWLRRLVEAAGGLTPKQRAAFVLRHIYGLSARETAEALDTSLASVNSSLQRARSALRESLGGPDPA